MRHQGTNNEAPIAPRLDPALKMPVAKARSRLGNHSATVLIDAGKLPPSPKPNALRITMCMITSLPAKAFRIPNPDQRESERAKPSLVPILSIIQPDHSHAGIKERE